MVQFNDAEVFLGIRDESICLATDYDVFFADWRKLYENAPAPQCFGARPTSRAVNRTQFAVADFGLGKRFTTQRENDFFSSLWTPNGYQAYIHRRVHLADKKGWATCL